MTAREVIEPGRRAVELQFGYTCRTITLFSNDDFCFIICLIVRIISVEIVFSMNHHNDISILLDGARLTQIAHPRPVTLALFGLTIQLTKTH